MSREREIEEMEDRCQPIGCDNGYHLQGCRYLWRDMTAEQLACLFHETYERLAPDHGYRTREASAKPWTEVPSQNKGLMIAVAAHLLEMLRDTDV